MKADISYKAELFRYDDPSDVFLRTDDSEYRTVWSDTGCDGSYLPEDADRSRREFRMLFAGLVELMTFDSENGREFARRELCSLLGIENRLYETDIRDGAFDDKDDADDHRNESFFDIIDNAERRLKKRNLSAEKLCRDLLNISNVYLSKIKNNENSRPSEIMLMRIAVGLELTPGETKRLFELKRYQFPFHEYEFEIFEGMKKGCMSKKDLLLMIPEDRRYGRADR